MDVNNISRVYLVGIGGIGMSALARYFHHRGCVVCGYDKTPTPLTDALISEGMVISFIDETNVIPEAFREPAEGTLIIYTPAVPQDSAILTHFRAEGYVLLKRSEVLGILSQGQKTIAVAGTHGKTTTSCLIAHILKSSGIDCSAFMGGISANYQSNVLFGKSDIMVVEADEYDRSFLRLHPDIAVITSMDADHLDIYGDGEQLKESFRLFAAQLKEGGTLIRRTDLDLEGGIRYSVDGDADVFAKNIHIEGGQFVFDFHTPLHTIEALRLGMPGLHNVENAVAAIEVALAVGVSINDIRTALGSFRGVKRRFEYIVTGADHIYIDDYAHHPEELRACFTSVRMLYPHMKLTVIFQPHLYSRTRDFAYAFAAVLSEVDELILLDIYPAREQPIEGVSAEMIRGKMTMWNTRVCGKEEALDFVRSTKPELLLTVGAGDIDQLVSPIKNSLLNHE
ncbi:MAG: UDP-N-acetylmuramate--L-alanine ligase [Mucilaginibacter polytrichastri]|nr:UDP-N-acetylmuramate--L-alanine ligase [Mucilaginibacter polytrichastri]